MSIQEKIAEPEFKLAPDSQSNHKPNTPAFYAHGVAVMSFGVAAVFLFIVSLVPQSAVPWVLWTLAGIWAVATAWAVAAAFIGYKEEVRGVQD